MEMSTWQGIWTFVFYAASALFYGTVTVVALKGFGDVAAMIRGMIAARHSAP